jgi:hypothetical protein
MVDEVNQRRIEVSNHAFTVGGVRPGSGRRERLVSAAGRLLDGIRKR